ncbi:hypothetical protein PHLGIDRAFT_114697 [Phlebiopsis gigantea 11061_1 CR5-6]|uniref:Uncharacterized protein n=1 Tax=Phlebiopsis gigantea (strain 11061_1 CR5-6) TaxID=745531 RepID=A0A0C3PUH5_PHLG1|nr:hypothetical protein PHLGIDRAFT_114697 [Phlebiopsis gigantea 11061_1 CR5-6]
MNTYPCWRCEVSFRQEIPNRQAATWNTVVTAAEEEGAMAIPEEKTAPRPKIEVKPLPGLSKDVKDAPVSPPKAPRNHELLTKLQAELERETKARHQAKVSCSGERETRLALEKQLQAETRAYLEAKRAGEKFQDACATAVAALEEEKQTRIEFEAQVAKLRHSETSMKKQLSDAQAWCTQVSAYCTTMQEQAQAALADERRLKELLEKEKIERDQLVQMLEIETLGRARIEQLLETRKSEEWALAEKRSANAALMEELAYVQEQLESERVRSRNLDKELAEERGGSEHLNRLLKQFRDECAAPFVVPAIVDVFALIASITDDVLGAPHASG